MNTVKSLEQVFEEENGKSFKDELIRAANNDCTVTEASRILKMSFASIKKYAKRYGVKFKTHNEIMHERAYK